MSKKVLIVEWTKFPGATEKRRILKLSPNNEGFYICPIKNCLHVGFKSSRGLRKHIDTIHSWYYHFDKQPVFSRDDVVVKERIKRKASTHNVPAFSLDGGVGKEFLTWLQTTCGGGKKEKEAVQIGRRAMKFLMTSLGETEIENYVNDEYVDACLGSPSTVIEFVKTITDAWGLRSAGALAYLKAMTDLMDFRKASGLKDHVLRAFTTTEVYLRRGKENLRKRKKLECNRELEVEALIQRDSWASIEEMEKVIPYHTPRYKSIVERCMRCEGAESPCISDLAFATRFIATFLFLRVKCTRPMTYLFLTTSMIAKAKENSGYIDQTEFKTAGTYVFDTLILTDDVIKILETYVNNVRPKMHPTCDYLLVTTVGTQYSTLCTAMTILVKEAIGKSINPTRYRQIIETASDAMLNPTEQAAISKDQKHSSGVANRYYKKRISRDVAEAGRKCMDKIVGGSRSSTNEELANIVNDIALHESQIDENLVNKTKSILSASNLLSAELLATTNITPIDNIDETMDLSNTNLNELEITGSILGVEKEEEDEEDVSSEVICTSTLPPEFEDDVEVKKEEAQKQLERQNKPKKINKNKKFSEAEDCFLKQGILKYGKSNWAKILTDAQYQFDSSRTRDSLRMRANSVAFKLLKNLSSTNT